MNGRFKKHFLNSSLILFLVSLILATYQVFMTSKFFPGVYIGNTNLSLLNKQQATEILEAKFNSRKKEELEFYSKDKSFGIDLSSTKIDYSNTFIQAFEIGRNGSWVKKIADQIKSLFLGSILEPEVTLSIDETIQNITREINQPPQDATLSFAENNSTTSAQIKISPHQNGLAVDTKKLKQQLVIFLIFDKWENHLPLKEIEPEITTTEAERVKQVLEETANEPLNLKYGDGTWVIDTKTLLPLVNIANAKDYLIDQEKLKTYLIKEVSPFINQPVKEGLFNFNSQTKRVTNFQPSQEGRQLDIDKTYQLVDLALKGDRAKTITLPVDVIQPKIRTEAVNDLGIKELIGRGISSFAGSIPNRIYNLTLASSRINGVLLAPGQIFSFNNQVGDISASSGYKQAYVIKEGRTVLDDGGGVCQVSTTIFRAVLNSGLPVVSRTAHAYRVGYYEQGFPPGLDATVFHPSVDFRFKNDSPAHVLMQAYVVGGSLYVDVYGTPDGRIVNLTKPVISSQTPPPSELRQDDPTLQKGVVKQVDWAAWGANVSFKRIVTKNGQEIANETWRSNYRPWQAVYLVGTKE